MMSFLTPQPPWSHFITSCSQSSLSPQETNKVRDIVHVGTLNIPPSNFYKPSSLLFLIAFNVIIIHVSAHFPIVKDVLIIMMCILIHSCVGFLFRSYVHPPRCSSSVERA